MSTTLSYSGTLTTMTCWCGMRHAVPSELADFQQRQHDNGNSEVQSIYCPLGHTHVPSGKPKVRRIEEERERARNEAATRAAERDQAEASARAHKGAATRARKRAAAGVCPCCKRTVKQLADHMKTKHPDFDPAKGTSDA